MRVLLTHPLFWPHVWRGAEREVRDVGVGLRSAGHDARVLTGAPPWRPGRAVVDGLPVTYAPLPRERVVRGRRWTREAAFAPVAAVAAAATRADLLHCFHYADAFGALQARRVGRRTPLVVKLTGSVRPELLSPGSLDERMLRTAIEGADAVWCNSAWAATEMEAFGRQMTVVPAGVDTAIFRPGVRSVDDARNGRAARPTVLVASSADEPRKRLVDLLVAWPTVVDAVPDAVLLVAGNASPSTRTELLQAAGRQAGSVRFLGRRTSRQLASDYREAWVTVAPALYEALGLTVLESLACGTPVVAADSGAHPELVPAGAGALAPPLDPEALAAAVVRWLARPPEPATRDAAVAAAAPYLWPSLLPRILNSYPSA